MTNEQRIRLQLSTIEGLADYLVICNDDYSKFYTSDSKTFEYKSDTVRHEIAWLKEKYNGEW